MGFPSISVKMPKHITFSFLQNMLTIFKLLLIAAINHLRLFKPQPQEEHDQTTTTNTTNNYVLLRDGACSSPVPVPVHVLVGLIKERLLVIEYGEKRNKVCSICLENIKRSDKIRELCNCSHMFHRDCLDTWIDEGQVTCPLCRSMLFPFSKEMGSSSSSSSTSFMATI